MAKIIIPPDLTFEQVAQQLAQNGITLDANQLPDGSYRVYVRQDKLNLFLTTLNPPNNENDKQTDLENCAISADSGTDGSGSGFRA